MEMRKKDHENADLRRVERTCDLFCSHLKLHVPLHMLEKDKKCCSVVLRISLGRHASF